MEERILGLIQVQAKCHEILSDGKTGHVGALAMDHAEETAEPEPVQFTHLGKRRLLRTLTSGGSFLALIRLLLPLLQLLLRIAEVALTGHQGVV